MKGVLDSPWCLKGDLRVRTGETTSYGAGRFAPSNLKDRDDYEQLKPCCAATEAFTATEVRW